MQNRESERSKAKVLAVPRVASIVSMAKSQVTNEQGDNLGRAEDIMVDLETGKIAFAVISTGGMIGREPRLYAIPWEALKISLHDKKLILNVTKESLQSAPSFHRNAWPDLSDLGWLRDVYAYYGIQPYWKD